MRVCLGRCLSSPNDRIRYSQLLAPKAAEILFRTSRTRRDNQEFYLLLRPFDQCAKTLLTCGRRLSYVATRLDPLALLSSSLTVAQRRDFLG
jgi:hypothetical protein